MNSFSYFVSRFHWIIIRAKRFILRISLVIIIVIAAALSIFTMVNRQLAESYRIRIIDSLSPSFIILTKPIAYFDDSIRFINSYIDIWHKNESLLAENKELRSLKSQVEKLQSENEHLRRLTHLRIDPKSDFVSAQIIMDMSGLLLRRIVIDAGVQSGVQIGQVVICDGGVVGRVLSVSDNTALVILLTDIDSRVPVYVGNQAVHAILAGDNSLRPYLAYYDIAQQINIGDRVVTTGSGGLYPANLLIGKVEAIVNNVPRINLLVKLNRIDSVSVIDYVIDNNDPIISTIIKDNK